MYQEPAGTSRLELLAQKNGFSTQIVIIYARLRSLGRYINYAEESRERWRTTVTFTRPATSVKPQDLRPALTAGQSSRNAYRAAATA